MMITLAIAASLLLGQADPASSGAAETNNGTATSPGMRPPEPSPDMPRTMNQDQLTKQIEKMQRMSPEEAARAGSELEKKLPRIDPSQFTKPIPTAEPVIPEVKDYSQLPEAEQVKYSAREFFTQLIAGDARNITNNCALPFMLEERKLATPDELFQEWLRNLRAKRTDLLTLYDIEVLDPTAMEKKYGKPPARLQNLPWRGAKTYVAVANLSGHAAIAVFRHTGVSWAVIGYAD